MLALNRQTFTMRAEPEGNVKIVGYIGADARVARSEAAGQVDGNQHLPPKPRAREKGDAALRGAARKRGAKWTSITAPHPQTLELLQKRYEQFLPIHPTAYAVRTLLEKP